MPGITPPMQKNYAWPCREGPFPTDYTTTE